MRNRRWGRCLQTLRYRHWKTLEKQNPARNKSDILDLLNAFTIPKGNQKKQPGDTISRKLRLLKTHLGRVTLEVPTRPGLCIVKLYLPRRWETLLCSCNGPGHPVWSCSFPRCRPQELREGCHSLFLNRTPCHILYFINASSQNPPLSAATPRASHPRPCVRVISPMSLSTSPMLPLSCFCHSTHNSLYTRTKQDLAISSDSCSLKRCLVQWNLDRKLQIWLQTTLNEMHFLNFQSRSADAGYLPDLTGNT